MLPPCVATNTGAVSQPARLLDPRLDMQPPYMHAPSAAPSQAPQCGSNTRDDTRAERHATYGFEHDAFAGSQCISLSGSDLPKAFAASSSCGVYHRPSRRIWAIQRPIRRGCDARTVGPQPILMSMERVNRASNRPTPSRGR